MSYNNYSQESVASLPSEFSFDKRDSLLPDPRVPRDMSDKDLIKELVSENYNLKSTIQEQQRLIGELQGKLKEANDKLPDHEKVNSNTSLKIDIKNTDSLVIPHRSHKRKSSNPIEDFNGSGLDFNGTILANYNDTVLQDPPAVRPIEPLLRNDSSKSSIYSSDTVPPTPKTAMSPYRARIKIPGSSAPTSPSKLNNGSTDSQFSQPSTRPISPSLRSTSPVLSLHNNQIDEELSNVTASLMDESTLTNGGNDQDDYSDTSLSMTLKSTSSPSFNNPKNLTVNTIRSNDLSLVRPMAESPQNSRVNNIPMIHAPHETPKQQANPSFSSATTPISARSLTPSLINHGLNSTPKRFPNLSSPKHSHHHTPVISSPIVSTFQHTPGYASPSMYSEKIQSPVMDNQQVDNDVPLFVEPEDFHTISIEVSTTIYSPQLKKNEEPQIGICVRDRNTKKEMWKIKKSLSQVLQFDATVRPMVDSFSLPPISERMLFYSVTPSKVDARRVSLQDYFNTLFVIPHMPQLVLYRICRFLSLDFVNPLDDFKSGAKKEGYLIRRAKGLGNNWKVRWCQIDGTSLDLFESQNGPLTESVRLIGSQIGRQSNDQVAEEKGYKHAFLILEAKKNSLSSSYTKHFFCAETDAERDSWIDALIESIEPYNDSSAFSTKRRNSNASEISKFSGDDSMISQVKPANGIHSSRDIGDDSEESNGKGKKKRGFFAFRGRTNTSGSGQLSAAANTSAIDDDDSEVSATQHILDEMKLDTVRQSVFGRELEDAYQLSNHSIYNVDIPSIVFRCIDYLLRTGAIYEEGIFRLNGSASTIKSLRERFDREFDIDLLALSPAPDIHTVAGLLKLYLRELPSSILSTKYYPQFKLTATSVKDCSLLAFEFQRLVKQIDQMNFALCYSLFKFLTEVIDNKKTNLMSLRNVCIVFSPTLNLSVDILIPLIVDYECIFNNGSPISDDQREVVDLYIPDF